jgi:hypothetical protein
MTSKELGSQETLNGALPRSVCAVKEHLSRSMSYRIFLRKTWRLDA